MSQRLHEDSNLASEDIEAILPLDIIYSYLLSYLLDNEKDFLNAIGFMKLPYRKACVMAVNDLIGCKTSFKGAIFFMKMLFNEDRNMERIRRCRESLNPAFADYFKKYGKDGPYVESEQFTIVNVPLELRETALTYNCNELERGQFVIYREDKRYPEILRQLDVGPRHLRFKLSHLMSRYAKNLGASYDSVMQYWSIPCDHPCLDILLHDNYAVAALIARQVRQNLVCKPTRQDRRSCFAASQGMNRFR
jgi:hypothetical protein